MMQAYETYKFGDLEGLPDPGGAKSVHFGTHPFPGMKEREMPSPTLVRNCSGQGWFPGFGLWYSSNVYPKMN